jgi:hypothetical protein
MRAVPDAAATYRDFLYPLNVFMHILTTEEGEVSYLHYGLFERADEPIGTAQERSTELLLSRLPSPPARLLEAGIGLGTTLRRLSSLGYDVEGLTPDAQQIAAIRARYAGALHVHCAPFETFDTGRTYDTIVFQESSQYIDADALFTRAAALAPHVLVLDEFALEPVEGLHSLSGFLEAASRHGFALTESLDLSAKAAPTMQYFKERIPRYREQLIADLGLTDAQLDDLIASGARYIERYAAGVYGYRLLQFRR